MISLLHDQPCTQHSKGVTNDITVLRPNQCIASLHICRIEGSEIHWLLIVLSMEAMGDNHGSFTTCKILIWLLLIVLIYHFILWLTFCRIKMFVNLSVNILGNTFSIIKQKQYPELLRLNKQLKPFDWWSIYVIKRGRRHYKFSRSISVICMTHLANSVFYCNWCVMEVVCSRHLVNVYFSATNNHTSHDSTVDKHQTGQQILH